jgi:hypothetical protein
MFEQLTKVIELKFTTTVGRETAFQLQDLALLLNPGLNCLT